MNMKDKVNWKSNSLSFNGWKLAEIWIERKLGSGESFANACDAFVHLSMYMVSIPLYEKWKRIYETAYILSRSSSQRVIHITVCGIMDALRIWFAIIVIIVWHGFWIRYIDIIIIVVCKLEFGPYCIGISWISLRSWSIVISPKFGTMFCLVLHSLIFNVHIWIKKWIWFMVSMLAQFSEIDEYWFDAKMKRFRCCWSQ